MNTPNNASPITTPMPRRHLLKSLALGGMLLSPAGAMMLQSRAAQANADPKLQGLVDQARITVQNFANDGNYSDMRRQLANAKGALVLPQLIKASFIFGGEGGSGLLLAKNAGSWSQPAHYTLAAGSVGFQIGGEVSEVILLLMSSRAVEAVLRNEFKLGADVSVAAGPVGGGIEASTTSNLGADILSYSRSKGLAIGVSLEGAVITSRHSRNESYYGRSVHPRDILFQNTVSNPGTSELRQALSSAELR